MPEARSNHSTTSMTYWWEENIEAQLMDPESLSQMFPYMCKITAEDGGAPDPSSASGPAKETRGAQPGRHDPITSTAITFLTCPLQLGLTEVGAMLFQGRSSLVYPYNLMSDRQKGFVREALSRRSEWNLFNSAVVFRKSPQQQEVTRKSPQHQPQPPPQQQGRQHGGGGHTLAPSAVLVALCGKVFESSAHPDPRRRVALCNIILQRVQGYIPIDKPVQRELNEWLAGRQRETIQATGQRETIQATGAAGDNASNSRD